MIRIRCLVAANRAADAFAYLDRVTTSDPNLVNDPKIRLAQASLLWTRDGYAAEQHVRYAIDHGLSGADASYARALVAADLVEAVKHLHACLDADPTYYDALPTLAITEFVLGRMHDAERTAAAWGIVYPKDRMPNLVNAFVASARGDDDAAVKQLGLVTSLTDGQRKLFTRLFRLNFLSDPGKLWEESSLVERFELIWTVGRESATSTGGFSGELSIRVPTSLRRFVSSVSLPALFQLIISDDYNKKLLEISTLIPNGFTYFANAKLARAAGDMKASAEWNKRAIAADSPLNVKRLAARDGLCAYCTWCYLNKKNFDLAETHWWCEQLVTNGGPQPWRKSTAFDQEVSAIATMYWYADMPAQAYQVCEEWLRREPNSSLAKYYLAEAAFSMGAYQSALEKSVELVAEGHSGGVVNLARRCVAKMTTVHTASGEVVTVEEFLSRLGVDPVTFQPLQFRKE